MAIYINGIGMISPQQPWNRDFLNQLAAIDSNQYLKAIEPNYEDFLDPRQLRRMSRILKMSFAAAFSALQNANIEVPDFIVTGTGLGCMEDTGSFLSNMISKDEFALNPTPFIQSTHNVIGSSIALSLQCLGYNQTYTQGYISFEHALEDALLQFFENPGLSSALVGAMDEQTATSQSLLERMVDSGVSMCGELKGEGSTFFTLTKDKNERSIASIRDVRSIYCNDSNKLKLWLDDFVAQNNLNEDNLDALMLRLNETSGKGKEMVVQHFHQSTMLQYEHLCGNHFAASSFGAALAASILSSSFIPKEVIVSGSAKAPKNILIFSENAGAYYSLILLEKC